MKPNKEVIRKWVDALRSGKYRQRKNYLGNENNEYCCLGVLCELAVKEGVISKEQENWQGSKINKYDDSTHVLPHSVMSWTGILDMVPQVGGESLDYWNDCEEKTFSEIADMIEKEYLKGQNNE